MLKAIFNCIIRNNCSIGVMKCEFGDESENIRISIFAHCEVTEPQVNEKLNLWLHPLPFNDVTYLDFEGITAKSSKCHHMIIDVKLFV